MWVHEGPPQRALRALLDLMHPQHPDAPARVHPAPPSLQGRGQAHAPERRTRREVLR